MYEIIFSKKATQQINKLDNHIKQRIWKKLQQCKENPYLYFEHLTQIDAFRLRVGDYRVIADINRFYNKIEVLRIGHRKNVYD